MVFLLLCVCHSKKKKPQKSSGLQIWISLREVGGGKDFEEGINHLFFSDNTSHFTVVQLKRERLTLLMLLAAV